MGAFLECRLGLLAVEYWNGFCKSQVVTSQFLKLQRLVKIGISIAIKHSGKRRLRQNYDMRIVNVSKISDLNLNKMKVYLVRYIAPSQLFVTRRYCHQ